MAEIDRSLIGSETEPLFFEVEKGAIRKFADAIGDPNPLYRDADHARRFGYENIVAPPTFPVCFRPPAELPWIQNLDRRRIVAGETAFEYVKPLVAGMKPTCRVKLTGVDDKQGSKGSMELMRQELSAHDEAGALVVVVRRTTVYRSAKQITERSLA
jgi:acyl dehydratase